MSGRFYGKVRGKKCPICGKDIGGIDSATVAINYNRHMKKHREDVASKSAESS